MIVSSWFVRDRPLTLTPALSRDAGEGAFVIRLDAITF
jgi:hypothetical protein